MSNHKIEHWCSGCGMTLSESVSNCSDHGVVCCVCYVHVAPGLAEYVGDLMLASRGAWACPDCADEVIREAHADIADDEPHTCGACERAKERAEETRLAAMAQAATDARDAEIEGLCDELLSAEADEQLFAYDYDERIVYTRQAECIRDQLRALGVDVEDELQNRAEAAEQRRVEDYYGGGGPQADAERRAVGRAAE